MSAPETVGIVGAGPFGTALAYRLASADRSVLLWSRTDNIVGAINERRENPRTPGLTLPPSVSATNDPRELAEAARFIVLAVSSMDVHDRLHSLGDFLSSQHLMVHAVGAWAGKGDLRVSEIIERETPVLRIGALAGPALWPDLVAGTFASMVVASHFAEVTAETRRLISVPPALRLYSSSDLLGVELASALASAYTLAVGLSDGLGLGLGPRAVLITRTLAEASRLGRVAGAADKTFAGLAGLGNLLVRTQSDRSAEYQAGVAYGRGQPVERASEGVGAALAGVRMARRLGVRVPVLAAIAAVLSGEMTAAEAAAAAADTVALEE